MNLKNYTSEVPAITSMGKIEKALVEAGATDISKKYEDGVCIAIRFRILHKTSDSLGVPLFFELPAKVDACFKVLWKEVKRPLSDTEKRIRQQAERTAWKITEINKTRNMTYLLIYLAGCVGAYWLMKYLFVRLKRETWTRGFRLNVLFTSLLSVFAAAVAAVLIIVALLGEVIDNIDFEDDRPAKW